MGKRPTLDCLIHEKTWIKLPAPVVAPESEDFVPKIRRLAMATIIVIGACSLDSSTASANDFFYFFPGSNSCGSWLLDPSRNLEVEDWVLGYWSGLNANAAHTQVGHTTDALGIMAEVQLACKNDPSLTIIGATIQTYNKLETLGR